MLPATIGSPDGFSGGVLRTILVVEDEETIRSSITEFLRECGYVVIAAGDVSEAKDLLLNWHVDLVFSDINMPNREAGFALEKWIGHYHPGVKVLLASGFPHAAAETRHLREPTLHKPYSYTALLQRVDRLFDMETNVYR